MKDENKKGKVLNLRSWLSKHLTDPHSELSDDKIVMYQDKFLRFATQARLAASLGIRTGPVEGKKK